VSRLVRDETRAAGKRGDPPRVGTQKVLAHRDHALASAFNQNVAAVRELQSIVRELQDDVARLLAEKETGG
jgi:hypothetical protein